MKSLNSHNLLPCTGGDPKNKPLPCGPIKSPQPYGLKYNPLPYFLMQTQPPFMILLQSFIPRPIFSSKGFKNDPIKGVLATKLETIPDPDLIELLLLYYDALFQPEQLLQL